jgi:prepilin-type N-terminal cleavage/methylation domain-containing protein
MQATRKQANGPMGGKGRRRAFTLIELIIVVLILGIVAAIFVPAAGANLHSSRLKMAANVLAADIDFCASECIAHPGDMRGIQFNTTTNQYTVEDLATNIAISHPADSQPYINDFATGRNLQLAGVTVTSTMMGTTALSLLTFDAYGRPLITSNFVITLSYNGSTMTVTVAKNTGDISITG